MNTNEITPEKVEELRVKVITEAEAEHKLEIAHERLHGVISQMLATLSSSIEAEVSEYIDEVQQITSNTPMGGHKTWDLATKFYPDGSAYTSALPPSPVVVVNAFNKKDVVAYKCRTANNLKRDGTYQERIQSLMMRGVTEDRIDDIALHELEHVNAIRYYCEVNNTRGSVYCFKTEGDTRYWRWETDRVSYQV